MISLKPINGLSETTILSHTALRVVDEVLSLTDALWFSLGIPPPHTAALWFSL
jgi:hypothetical protein